MYIFYLASKDFLQPGLAVLVWIGIVFFNKRIRYGVIPILLFPSDF